MGLLLTSSLSNKAFAQYVHPSDEVHYICDDSFEVSLQNVDNDYDLTSFTSFNFDNPSFAYDVQLGLLTFTTGGLIGPESYGFFEFELTYQGNQIAILTIYVLDCCLEGIDYDYIIFNEDYSNLFTGSQVSNADFLVLDHFTIDDDVTFSQCNFLFGADAKMTTQSGTHLFFLNTLLQKACGYCWDGIYADGQDSRITIRFSELSGSCNGFQLTNNVLFKSVGTDYLANQHSIFGQGYTLPGTFAGNSRWHIFGNTFDAVDTITPVVVEHPLSTVYQSTNPYVNHTAHVAINIALAAEYIQIGDTAKSPNVFTGIDMYGITPNTSKVSLQNNTFKDLAWGVYARFSDLILGIDSTTIINQFLTTNPPLPGYPLRYSGLFTEYCNHYIQNNSFNYSLIDINKPSNDSIEDKKGTYLGDNYSYETLAEFTGNVNNISALNIELYNNALNNSQFEFRDIITTSLNEGVKIHNNYFRSSGISTDKAGDYRVKFINTPGVRFGDNIFFYTTGFLGGPVMGKPCIYLNNVPNAQIKRNEFLWATKCIYGTGDLTNTIISCNKFSAYQYGMQFYSAIISDFGSDTAGVENTFDIQDTISNTYPTIVANIELKDCPTTTEPEYNAQFYATQYTTNNPWYFGPGAQSTKGVRYLDTLGNVSTNPFFSDQLIKNPNAASGFMYACNVLNKQTVVSILRKSEVNIFPNPSSGQFTLESDVAIKEVNMFDVSGKKVFHSENTTVINVVLPEGIYFIYCTLIDNNTVTRKLIIAH